MCSKITTFQNLSLIFKELSDAVYSNSNSKFKYLLTLSVQGVQKKTALFKKLITFYVFVLGYSNRLQSKEHELYFCYRATFSRFHRILDTLVRHESRAKF